eukprot:gene31903-36014_t
MAQRAAPSVSESQRAIEFGEEIVVDIKVMAGNSARNKHKQTFGGSTCALTAIDANSHYHWGYLLKSTKETLESLVDIRRNIRAAGRHLRTIRTDNAFVTRSIK